MISGSVLLRVHSLNTSLGEALAIIIKKYIRAFFITLILCQIGLLQLGQSRCCPVIVMRNTPESFTWIIGFCGVFPGLLRARCVM